MVWWGFLDDRWVREKEVIYEADFLFFVDLLLEYPPPGEGGGQITPISGHFSY